MRYIDRGPVCIRPQLVDIALSKPPLDSNVALCPSESREPFLKHCHARLCFRIVVRECVEEPDTSHPIGLLR